PSSSIVAWTDAAAVGDAILGASTEAGSRETIVVTGVTPALTVTSVCEATPPVATAKGTDVPPAGTITLAGTVTCGELALSGTVAPVGGAASVRVTVPLAGLPPTKLAGITATASGCGGVTASMQRTVVSSVAKSATSTANGTADVEIANVACFAPAAT